MGEAAMQGADQLIGSKLGYSILLKDTSKGSGGAGLKPKTNDKVYFLSLFMKGNVTELA